MHGCITYPYEAITSSSQFNVSIYSYCMNLLRYTHDVYRYTYIYSFNGKTKNTLSSGK